LYTPTAGDKRQARLDKEPKTFKEKIDRQMTRLVKHWADKDVKLAEHETQIAQTRGSHFLTIRQHIKGKRLLLAE